MRWYQPWEEQGKSTPDREKQMWKSELDMPKDQTEQVEELSPYTQELLFLTQFLTVSGDYS